MTLHVLIRRQGWHEAAAGTLRAWVCQGGRLGSNILAGRQITSLKTAKREVENALQHEFARSLAPLTIEWTIEEGRSTPQDDATRDAAADSVGRDWRKMAPGGGA